MISIWFQLCISSFFLSKACNCYKLHDYTLQLPTNRQNQSREFMDDDSVPKYITRLWTIEVTNDDQLPSSAMEERVDKLARELSMENLGQIGQIPDYYTFAASNFTNDGIENTLLNHPDIEQYERQEIISIHKYSTKVPVEQAGWQLDHPDGGKLLDINVIHAWCHGINGEGVVVAIVDDGVQWQHNDLKDNYFAEGSRDFVDDDFDPTPPITSSKNIMYKHGTHCAGLASAVGKDKNICGTGVAYRSKFSGVRLLSNAGVSSPHLALAMNHEMNKNHIYSCSFGPPDDGKNERSLQMIVERAFVNGATKGRNSLGSIYVFASGNGGKNLDNCHYDEFVRTIYTIPIASVTEFGVTPNYGEKCSAIMTSTLSGNDEGAGRPLTATTSSLNRHECTYNFIGTSASAPLASGIIALMLQVRPDLSWRDVHHLIAMTSSHSTLSGEINLFQPDHTASMFIKNTAGYTYNDYHGFGFLDAWRVVNAARVWKKVPDMTSLQLNCPTDTGLTPGGTGEVSCWVSKLEGKGLATMENVLLDIYVKHQYRGALEYTFICPSGIPSKVETRNKDIKYESPGSHLVIRTVKCWGESPVGEFTLQVLDTRTKFDKNEDVAVYVKRLTIYGSRMTSQQLRKRWKTVTESYKVLHVNETVNSLHYCVVPTIVSSVNVFVIVISVLFGTILLITVIFFCYKRFHRRRNVDAT